MNKLDYPRRNGTHKVRITILCARNLVRKELFLMRPSSLPRLTTKLRHIIVYQRFLSNYGKTPSSKKPTNSNETVKVLKDKNAIKIAQESPQGKAKLLAKKRQNLIAKKNEEINKKYDDDFLEPETTNSVVTKVANLIKNDSKTNNDKEVPLAEVTKEKPRRKKKILQVEIHLKNTPKMKIWNSQSQTTSLSRKQKDKEGTKSKKSFPIVIETIESSREDKSTTKEMQKDLKGKSRKHADPTPTQKPIIYKDEYPDIESYIIDPPDKNQSTPPQPKHDQKLHSEMDKTDKISEADIIKNTQDPSKERKNPSKNEKKEINLKDTEDQVVNESTENQENRNSNEKDPLNSLSSKNVSDNQEQLINTKPKKNKADAEKSTMNVAEFKENPETNIKGTIDEAVNELNDNPENRGSNVKDPSNSKSDKNVSKSEDRLIEEKSETNIRNRKDQVVNESEESPKNPESNKTVSNSSKQKINTKPEESKDNVQEPTLHVSDVEEKAGIKTKDTKDLIDRNVTKNETKSKIKESNASHIIPDLTMKSLKVEMVETKKDSNSKEEKPKVTILIDSTKKNLLSQLQDQKAEKFQKTMKEDRKESNTLRSNAEISTESLNKMKLETKIKKASNSKDRTAESDTLENESVKEKTNSKSTSRNASDQDGKFDTKASKSSPTFLDTSAKSLERKSAKHEETLSKKLQTDLMNESKKKTRTNNDNTFKAVDITSNAMSQMNKHSKNQFLKENWLNDYKSKGQTSGALKLLDSIGRALSKKTLKKSEQKNTIVTSDPKSQSKIANIPKNSSSSAKFTPEECKNQKSSDISKEPIIFDSKGFAQADTTTNNATKELKSLENLQNIVQDLEGLITKLSDSPSPDVPTNNNKISQDKQTRDKKPGKKHLSIYSADNKNVNEGNTESDLTNIKTDLNLKELSDATESKQEDDEFSNSKWYKDSFWSDDVKLKVPEAKTDTKETKSSRPSKESKQENEWYNDSIWSDDVKLNIPEKITDTKLGDTEEPKSLRPSKESKQEDDKLPKSKWYNDSIWSDDLKLNVPEKVTDTKVTDTKVTDTKVTDTKLPDAKERKPSRPSKESKQEDDAFSKSKWYNDSIWSDDVKMNVPVKVTDTKVPDTKVTDTKLADTKETKPSRTSKESKQEDDAFSKSKWYNDSIWSEDVKKNVPVKVTDTKVTDTKETKSSRPLKESKQENEWYNDSIWSDDVKMNVPIKVTDTKVTDTKVTDAKLADTKETKSSRPLKESKDDSIWSDDVKLKVYDMVTDTSETKSGLSEEQSNLLEEFADAMKLVSNYSKDVNDPIELISKLPKDIQLSILEDMAYGNEPEDLQSSHLKLLDSENEMISSLLEEITDKIQSNLPEETVGTDVVNTSYNTEREEYTNIYEIYSSHRDDMTDTEQLIDENEITDLDENEVIDADENEYDYAVDEAEDHDDEENLPRQEPKGELDDKLKKIFPIDKLKKELSESAAQNQSALIDTISQRIKADSGKKVEKKKFFFLFRRENPKGNDDPTKSQKYFSVFKMDPQNLSDAHQNPQNTPFKLSPRLGSSKNLLYDPSNLLWFKNPSHTIEIKITKEKKPKHSVTDKSDIDNKKNDN